MRIPLGRRLHVAEVVAAVGGAVLLAGSWLVVAVAHHVPGWEASVFEVINDLPSLLWPFLWVPMQVGSLVGSLVAVVLTAVISRNGRLAAAALLASQVAFWTAKGIKDLVRRGRPEVLLRDIHLREHAGGLGYVSGHTAVAFAIAAAIGPSVPARWQPLVAAVAVVVGVARVYAGVHLPLDAVGGAGIGLLCGIGSRWLFGLGGEGLPPRPGVET